MNENLKKQLGNLTEGAMTIPNLLSAIRIVLIPVFLVLFLKGSYLAAVIVLGISGLTDLFDGKIARAFNQVSNLGKLLDPIADKLTQITLAIAYFFAFHGMDDRLLRGGSWLFWIFVLKEVLMLVGGIVMLTHDVTPRAAIMYGKVATVAYYVVMIALLLFAPVFGVFRSWFTLPSAAIVILVAIAAVLTLIAFCAYAPDLRQVKQKDVPSGESKE
ncbi:MAG: CDP-alcohol phosphatidyltransferase family protein [Clostridia bacterium]|nr:CDP-alcohol phosphatidyltransferase family protein [Clostridia bacterium]